MCPIRGLGDESGEDVSDDTFAAVQKCFFLFSVEKKEERRSQ